MSAKGTGMQLLVDAGNTRIKWVLVAADTEVAAIDAKQQQAEAYAENESPQQGVTRILSRLLAADALLQVTLVHVLGRELTDALRALCMQARCKLVQVNTQQHRYGIKSAYTNPAHLGADRLVALLAAQFMAQGQPAIVIDCGTAVTVDVLAMDGQHPGGLILPGLSLLGDSLINRTQARHMAMSEFDQPVIMAQDTAKGIGSGCLFALVGAIEGICRRMQNELSADPLMIICGGDAALIHPYLDGDYYLAPALVMTGLRVIAEQDKCGP